jgi:hypothetical protein
MAELDFSQRHLDIGAQGGHQPIQSNLGSLDWIAESSEVVGLD